VEPTVHHILHHLSIVLSKNKIIVNTHKKYIIYTFTYIYIYINACISIRMSMSMSMSMAVQRLYLYIYINMRAITTDIDAGAALR
jgi:hypothetical protein